MSQNHSSLSCPVCKSGISREKLIPIYINENTKDPRTSNPRPNATRTPPEPNPNSSNARSHPDFNFSVGFGLFPGLFGLSFNIPITRSQNSDTMTKIMFVLLTLFILTILF
jgi:E3 ubiquitin-protein ligase RNF5